jgi:hypothetical protein
VLVEAVMAAAVTTAGMKVRPPATPAVMVAWTAPIGTRTGPSVDVLITSGRVVLLVLPAQPTPKTWMHLLFFLLPGRFAPGGA